MKKEEQERKKEEAIAKKKERQELEMIEQKETLAKITKVNPVKVSQAMIREETAKRQAAAKGVNKKPEEDTHLTKPLSENLNR